MLTDTFWKDYIDICGVPVPHAITTNTQFAEITYKSLSPILTELHKLHSDTNKYDLRIIFHNETFL